MTVAISDRLRPDGRLVTKFERIQTKDNTPSVQSSRTLVFRVRDEYPFFAATFGIVASRSREPEIAIVNSSTVITFERDGQEQRGFEQMIVVRDAGERFRPLGSVATFLNFRVWQRLYAAPGFRLDRQAFEEPLVGVSWFQKLGTIGIAFTGGVDFTREVEIIESSGFRDGQRLEPTLGLTADAIPAEERRHSRLFLSVSFKY